MERDELLAMYEIGSHGRIVTPGKFEMCPIFVPAYYDLILDGFADSDDGEVATFRLGPDDIARWPELGEHATELEIWTDESGFVHFRVRYV